MSFLISHFFPIFVKVGFAKNFPLCGVRQEGRRGIGDSRKPGLHQAVVINEHNEHKAEDRSVSLFFPAHFPPSVFFFPASLRPSSTPSRIPSSVSQGFSVMSTANLAIGTPSGVTPDSYLLLFCLCQGQKWDLFFVPCIRQSKLVDVTKNSKVSVVSHLMLNIRVSL